LFSFSFSFAPLSCCIIFTCLSYNLFPNVYISCPTTRNRFSVLYQYNKSSDFTHYPENNMCSLESALVLFYMNCESCLLKTLGLREQPVPPINPPLHLPSTKCIILHVQIESIR
jgi:hypothetical protein